MRLSQLTFVIGIAVFGGTVGAAPCRSQSQPSDIQRSFEVASIKPATPSGPGRGGRSGGSFTDAGMFSARNASLKGLIAEAYQVPADQITGGPTWLDTDAFDIAARAGQPAKPEQMRLLLQALLAERFKLALHRETKQLSLYALVVGKNGPKFHSLKEGEDAPAQQRNHLSFKDMSSLAGILSTFAERPVVDRTGLKGDFYLDLDMSKPLQSMDADGPGAAIMSAVEDQFGLKLVLTKGPIEVLIVDGAEKPSEN